MRLPGNIESSLSENQAGLLLNPEADSWALKNAIDAGLSIEELKKIKEEYKFSDEELAGLLGVSSRTILRRKNKHLTPDESSKMVLLAKVLNRCRSLMGSPGNVLEWMHFSQPELNHNSPIEICTNIIGYEEVMNLLGQMEWGLP